MTLNNLGILDSDQNRMADARKEYEEALKICGAFAKQDPEQFTTDVKRLKTLPRELSIKLSLSAICATGIRFESWRIFDGYRLPSRYGLRGFH
jgi:hypothetical protein